MNFDFRWIFQSNYSATVGGYSLILSILGTALTLFGLYLTYRQAKRAQTSANSAQQAVREFKFKADRYDAHRDLSQATYALQMTKRHLNNDAWRDASDTFEDARQAIIRIQHSSPDLTEIHRRDLTKIATSMAKFCNAVEAALAEKGNYPEKSKVLASIRRHFETIVLTQRILQNGENQ